MKLILFTFGCAKWLLGAQLTMCYPLLRQDTTPDHEKEDKWFYTF